MTLDRVEGMRAFCADLNTSIQFSRETHAPVRAVLLIELARDDLQRSIYAIEDVSTVVEMGLKVKK